MSSNPISAGAKSENTALNLTVQKSESNFEIKVEHKDQLKLLVAELKKDQNSIQFQLPVPWEALGLFNYP